MDKSHASSSEALSGSKRGREGSYETGCSPDLEYEAALREKLEAERAVRHQVDRDRAAWAAGLEWLQRDERARAEAIVDPGEAAVAGVKAPLLGPRLISYVVRAARCRPGMGEALDLALWLAPGSVGVRAAVGFSRAVATGLHPSPSRHVTFLLRTRARPRPWWATASSPTPLPQGFIPSRGAGPVAGGGAPSGSATLNCFACHRSGHFQSWC